MEELIIIGIDPGTRVTGYGIIRFKYSQHQVLDFGCIRPPAALKLSDRYLIIHNGIKELIKKYRPNRLAIETQYVRNNPQSAIKLGMARGVCILPAKLEGIPVYEYAPSQIKLAVCGNGNASKFQVQGMVKQLLRLQQEPKPEDAADALAIAICDLHMKENALSLKAEM